MNLEKGHQNYSYSVRYQLTQLYQINNVRYVGFHNKFHIEDRQ